MYLGVRVVIAKTIERIHKANLINFCIVSIEFANPADYDKIEQGDELRIDGLLEAIKSSDTVEIAKADGSFEFTGRLELSERDREILLSAGLLNYTRKKADK
jgi:aconitate hydratase